MSANSDLLPVAMSVGPFGFETRWFGRRWRVYKSHVSARPGFPHFFLFFLDSDAFPPPPLLSPISDGISFHPRR